MAFACTAYKAWGETVRVSGGGATIKKRSLQYFELTLTAAAADVDLDLGDVAGAAWSAIDGDATGLAAKTALTAILAKVERFVDYSCPEIDFTYLPVYGDATPAASSVGVINNTAKNCPEFVFAAGEGQTAYKFVFQWTLTTGEAPVVAGF
jgi:hypothetical protein